MGNGVIQRATLGAFVVAAHYIGDCGSVETTCQVVYASPLRMNCPRWTFLSNNTERKIGFVEILHRFPSARLSRLGTRSQRAYRNSSRNAKRSLEILDVTSLFLTCYTYNDTTRAICVHTYPVSLLNKCKDNTNANVPTHFI